MNVFLTGVSGFIGSHIAEHLVFKGHSVLCAKREQTDLWRCKMFINKVRWVSTDILRWEDEVILFKPQVIIHAAWDGVNSTERESWDIQISNLYFLKNLLYIAKEIHCEKFIGIGSQAEYGNFSGRIDENYPAHPNSAYGAVKLASLAILRTFCDIQSIKWYWFRLFSCFGEREGEEWLIPSAIKSMLNQKSMDLTSGEQKYAYLHVGEVAKTIIATLTTSAESGIYNLSSSYGISVRELLEYIKTRVNPSFKLNFGVLPYRKGQSPWIQGNNNKVCNNIRLLKDYKFEEYLCQTIEYYTMLFKNYN